MADKVQSTTARMKVGQQPSKGTAADTLVCGMMQMSSLNTSRDTIDKGGEHGCNGGPDRATAHKSLMRYSSYIVNGGFRGYGHPDMIGYWLLGAGFTVVTTAGSGGSAGTYSHVFTLANRTAVPWLTVQEQIGSKLRQAVDARVNRLTFTANNRGFVYDGTYQALLENEAPGSGLTVTNEDDAEILSSRGSITVNYDPDGTPVSLLDNDTEGFTLVINNPLNTDQQRLLSFGRSDLPQNGLDVTGTVEGMNVIYANYERIKNGASGADSPAEVASLAKIDLTFQSAEKIAATAIPYSIRFEVTHSEIDLSDFQAEGTSLVQWNFPYRMVDDNVTPIRITLVNALPSYAA
jgi:hypothetical protein